MYFNLMNQTCECFILIICIIINIDKKSKLKCVISSFFSNIGLRNLLPRSHIHGLGDGLATDTIGHHSWKSVYYWFVAFRIASLIIRSST